MSLFNQSFLFDFCSCMNAVDVSSCFVTGLVSETKLDLVYDAGRNSITWTVWHKHATWKINRNRTKLKTVKSNPIVNCQFHTLLALFSFLTENIHQKTNLGQNQYLKFNHHSSHSGFKRDTNTLWVHKPNRTPLNNYYMSNNPCCAKLDQN